MKPLLLFLFIIIFTGCARPGDHPIPSNCLWTEDDSRSLNLAKIADRRHLRYDAVTAEDVAIRWADTHFRLQPQYDQRRAECMTKLFTGLARQHGVDIDVVRQYSRERDWIIDSGVILSFAALYAVMAYLFAGRIVRRFALDDPGFWVMTIAMAMGASLTGVLAGGLWSILIETFRLNSGHLSYRMNRIPLRQYWPVAFGCGFMIFALITLLRSRATLHSQSKSLLKTT
jgi:hypothetical protein